MDTRTIHDYLLSVKPTEKDHDVAACPFCTNETASDGGEQMAEDGKIYDQATVDALVAAAVESAVKEAREETDAEVIRLNAELEQAQSELTEAKASVEDLESSISERDEAARLGKLAEERAKQVSEKASFTDEQIDERKERWAKMPDEEFEALLAEYELVAAAAAEGKREKPKPKAPVTRFDQARDTSNSNDGESVVATFFQSQVR
jgi:chromosome segregation ATPase